jgi:hypothetical protein
MDEGELKTFVTSSGVKVRPDMKKEVSHNETILNWFSPDDQDTELGEVFRTEIWAHPTVLDAYDNGDGDEVDSEPESPAKAKNTKKSSENEDKQLVDDEAYALALSAAWADSDSE